VGVEDEVEGVEGLLDDTRSEGMKAMELVLGKGFKLPAWEQVLNTMPPGQIAKVKLPTHVSLLSEFEKTF
jgi:hypothetical protein